MTLSVVSRLGSKGWSLSKGDMALAAGLLCVALLAGVFVNTDRPGTVAPHQWWHWLLIATPSLLVAFRRVKPEFRKNNAPAVCSAPMLRMPG